MGKPAYPKLDPLPLTLASANTLSMASSTLVSAIRRGSEVTNVWIPSLLKDVDSNLKSAAIDFILLATSRAALASGNVYATPTSTGGRTGSIFSTAPAYPVIVGLYVTDAADPGAA